MRTALFLLVNLTGCCASYPAMQPGTAENPRIQAIDLGISNAYVVYGQRPILVDSGAAVSADALEDALEALGINPGALSLVVMTHGHADHAGSAKRIRAEWRVPLAIGKGDVEMIRAGHNRPLMPTSITASILRPFVDDPFPPFAADIEIASPLDLRPYGVDGVAMPAPGHTPGSVVMLLRDGDAFVGDLFLGGYLGGAIAPGTPDTHYFHDDRIAAEHQICVALERGAKRFFLGHGGPVTADAARARFCAQ